jgi:hypothetical protein
MSVSHPSTRITTDERIIVITTDGWLAGWLACLLAWFYYYETILAKEEVVVCLDVEKGGWNRNPKKAF